MTRVTSAPLPPSSALHDRFGPGDFLDCYCVRSDLTLREAAEIITSFPGWAQGLVHLRSLLVSPFGLKRSGPEGVDKVGPFPVERELLAGFNDKHLDFRVSVLSQNGQICLSTWVHPHNLAGRAYLTAIMPFHMLIVRDALTRVGRSSDQRPVPI